MEGIGRKGKEGLSGKCEGYAKKGMGTERKGAEGEVICMGRRREPAVWALGSDGKPVFV